MFWRKKKKTKAAEVKTSKLQTEEERVDIIVTEIFWPAIQRASDLDGVREDELAAALITATHGLIQRLHPHLSHDERKIRIKLITDVLFDRKEIKPEGNVIRFSADIG